MWSIGAVSHQSLPRWLPQLANSVLQLHFASLFMASPLSNDCCNMQEIVPVGSSPRDVFLTESRCSPSFSSLALLHLCLLPSGGGRPNVRALFSSSIPPSLWDCDWQRGSCVPSSPVATGRRISNVSGRLSRTSFQSQLVAVTEKTLTAMGPVLLVSRVQILVM